MLITSHLSVRFIVKNRNYVYEENEKFFITYNASLGFLKLILGIGFSVLMLWLAQTAFVGSIVIPLTIFFSFTLTIFVISIPYSISNIRKDNKGIIWAGSKEGLYLGGDTSERFFYEWEHILKVTFIEKLEYTEHVDEHRRESNILLFEVKSIKNPITSKFSKFMFDFDKKKSGELVMKFNYPGGTREKVLELLKKYEALYVNTKLLMSLYTLIIDFDGGTYVTQSDAVNTLDAPKNCIANWDISDLQDVLTEQDKSIILTELREEEFIPLKGIKNVWCGGVHLHQHFLTLNLVKTESGI